MQQAGSSSAAVCLLAPVLFLVPEYHRNSWMLWWQQAAAELTATATKAWVQQLLAALDGLDFSDCRPLAMLLIVKTHLGTSEAGSSSGGVHGAAAAASAMVVLRTPELGAAASRRLPLGGIAAQQGAQFKQEALYLALTAACTAACTFIPEVVRQHQLDQLPAAMVEALRGCVAFTASRPRIDWRQVRCLLEVVRGAAGSSTTLEDVQAMRLQQLLQRLPWRGKAPGSSDQDEDMARARSLCLRLLLSSTAPESVGAEELQVCKPILQQELQVGGWLGRARAWRLATPWVHPAAGLPCSGRARSAALQAF
jgi:hypothetical protein